MGGASSRRKGHDFERWVAKDLRDLVPSARRGFQTRGGGKEQPDVIAPHVHIECKVGKKPGIRAAVKQACDDADQHAHPVAIVKDDRCSPIVAMPYEDWREMYGAALMHWGLE